MDAHKLCDFLSFIELRAEDRLRSRRRQTHRQILGGQIEADLTLPVTYHVVIAFDRDAEAT